MERDIALRMAIRIFSSSKKFLKKWGWCIQPVMQLAPVSPNVTAWSVKEENLYEILETHSKNSVAYLPA